MGDGRVMILDGGVSSWLEHVYGGSLHSTLWSASFLATPQLTVYLNRVHSDFVQAGADIISTVSYQATHQRYISEGLCRTVEEADAMILRSVACARNALPLIKPGKRWWCQRLPVVAASVGPYGAYLANGAEYRGDYTLTFAELVAHHERKVGVLARCLDVDIIVFETIPTLEEALVYIHIMAAYPDKPYWLSFQCRDNAHIANGLPLVHVCNAIVHALDHPAANAATSTLPPQPTIKTPSPSESLPQSPQQSTTSTTSALHATEPSSSAESTLTTSTAHGCKRVSSLIGVGVNCVDPRACVDLVGVLHGCLPAAYERICYPNKGEAWDAVNKVWLSADQSELSNREDFQSLLLRCVTAGATVVGGCCRVTPDDIRTFVQSLSH